MIERIRGRIVPIARLSLNTWEPPRSEKRVRHMHTVPMVTSRPACFAKNRGFAFDLALNALRQ